MTTPVRRSNGEFVRQQCPRGCSGAKRADGAWVVDGLHRMVHDPVGAQWVEGTGKPAVSKAEREAIAEVWREAARSFGGVTVELLDDAIKLKIGLPEPEMPPNIRRAWQSDFNAMMWLTALEPAGVAVVVPYVGPTGAEVETVLGALADAAEEARALVEAVGSDPAIWDLWAGNVRQSRQGRG